MLTPRSVTQAELDHLISMLASGVLTSTHNGKTTQFATFDELRKRIEYLQSLTATAAELPRVTYVQRRG